MLAIFKTEIGNDFLLTAVHTHRFLLILVQWKSCSWKTSNKSLLSSVFNSVQFSGEWSWLGGKLLVFPNLAFWKHIVVVSEHYMSHLNLANIFIPLPKPTHNSGWNLDFIHTLLDNVNPLGSRKPAEQESWMQKWQKNM